MNLSILVYTVIEMARTQKTKHRKLEVGGSWVLVCGKDLRTTRSDYSFDYCPNCGDQI